MNFPKLTLILLLGSIGWTSSIAQTYSSLTIPAELKENANEVVRQDYMKFIIKDAKFATQHVKRIVTLLNGKSKEDHQYVWYDKSTKISNLSARIYDAFGKEIRKVKSKDFTDQSAVSRGTMYSDSRIKIAELNHTTYPYTVEIEYTKTHKQTHFNPSSYMQTQTASIENFDLIIEAPKDYPIYYKGHNTDLEPTIEKTAKTTTYTWSTGNLPVIKREPLSPPFNKIRPAILVNQSQFKYDDYTCDLNSWKTFGKFMYDINNSQDQLNPEMVKVVNNLIADATTDHEKIEILYRYLQENMRYVSVQLGIGGWQSFDADYVTKNKYGDCKALSNYMKAMLNEVGIESHWTLTYRGYGRPLIFEDFATPGSFNHMILNVPSEDMFLECTSNDYPINYLGVDNHDRKVLIITEEGGKLSKTPTYGLEQNQEINTVNITLDPKGAAVIKQQTELTGPSHDNYRYYSNNYSKEELEKMFLENSDLPAFTIDKLQITNGVNAPRSTIDFEIKVKRYASKAGRRIFLPLNKLTAFSYVPKQIENRIQPVNVKDAYREMDTFTFILPGDYELESLPHKQINLESIFGKYTIDIQIDGNQLIYKRILDIHAVELPADQYEKLRIFYKEIAKADGMKAVLVQKKA